MFTFTVSRGQKRVDHKNEISGHKWSTYINLNYYEVCGRNFKFDKMNGSEERAIKRAEEYCDYLNSIFTPEYWKKIQSIKYMGPIDEPYQEKYRMDNSLID